MHLAYGAAGGSNTRALRLYAQKHPGRAQPDRRFFGKIHSNLRESGRRFVDPPRARPVRDNVELQVLAQVDDNPHTSTRKIAANVGCSHGTVMHVLNEQLLHPFKLVQVQDPGPDDFPLRLQYCQWMRDRVGEVPRFLGLVASTDEKGFSREGTFNAHNNHYWAEENPHALHTRGYQRKFRVNVCEGIVGNHLLGPVILPGNLNGPMYLEFLQTTLEDMLEEVLPLDLWRDMWFQQDGCPAHWALAVRAYLDARFPGRWIGRRGPVAWPPRSPDLTPPDFFLWGAMEELVYASPVESEEDPMARIILAGEEIRHNPGVFERIRENWQKRIDKCFEQAGGHFENLL
ncbi:hypothetical protein ONE63_000008 [Megalurothrips usitatus]|uniref:Transposable element Tc3 transposase n=1 Tax=Megalurothrips usitatus TaxID=439358 RepID=A0AAV7Y111_9NEOP|nr:hypothetical protein ONE63_000008 [Megalurothrips usitatus]